jgi:hypothetical protein
MTWILKTLAAEIGEYGGLEARGKFPSRNLFLEVTNLLLDMKPQERMLSDESLLCWV